MFAGRLQPHQIDDVDYPNLQLGQMLAKDGYSSQDIQCRRIAAAGHHHVQFTILVVAGPLPDAHSLRAMHDCLVHSEPLRQGVLASHDDVHIIAAAQAVIEGRQQVVRIGRQVGPNNFGLLVDHMVEETGILVGEAVVVLLPDVGREHLVQRGDRPTPRQPFGDLEPFGMLTEHRIDDADESLVAVDKPVPTG
jgi:hypothetical protein